MQDWFEDLWAKVAAIAEQAAAFVWAAMPTPIKTLVGFLEDLTLEIWDKILAFFKDPLGSIKKGLDDLYSGLVSFIGWWDPTQRRFVGGFLGWLWDSVKNISSWISDAASWIYVKVAAGLSDLSTAVARAIATMSTALSGGLEWLLTKAKESIDGARTWAADMFPWLNDQVSAGLEWAVNRVGTMFDGASTILGDVIGSVFSGPLAILTDFFGDVSGLLSIGRLGELVGEVTGILDGVNATYLAPLARHSPLTPEEAASDIASFRSQQRDHWYHLFFYVFGTELGTFGQAETPATMMLSEPQIQASIALATEWFKAPYEYGYTPLLEQFWNKVYTPLLPPVVDLIRFVVREVITPVRFAEIMPYLGFKKEWADAYWEAHWVLPSPEHIYDAYHRNVIDVDERNKYIVWHDYKPEPRPGIRVSDQTIMGSLTKTLIPRVDLRRGLRLGRLARSDLDERYGWLGYEEDSELMTDIQVAVAYESEINKLRDNAKDDFVNGFSVEATLRANLEAIGLSPDVIEYHVADALADRERAHKKRILAIYLDAYLKDLKTDEDLAADAGAVIIEEGALSLYLEEAYIDKYKKPKVS